MSSILVKAHTALIWAGGIYVAFLALLTLPSVQRSLIFLHQIRFPFNADFSHPELYGFSPGKVLPFNLTTPDGETLGAWQVLPNDIYETWINENGGIPPLKGSLPDEVFERALRSPNHPTILYNHGNAATRAAPNRLLVARLMSSLNYNFVIYDYRGFADSTGLPSEEGLGRDARCAWDWVEQRMGTGGRGVRDRLAIMGQSLGTGVSVGLGRELADEDIHPLAIILVAPFASIPALLETYKLFDVVPLLAPFRNLPWVMKRFLRLLGTRFESVESVQRLKSPILILHAENDNVIPHTHSEVLFQKLISPSPSSSPDPSTNLSKIQETPLGTWGVVRRFTHPVSPTTSGKEMERERGEIIFAQAVKGAHNEIGTGEVSVRLIKDVLGGLGGVGWGRT
ncbi:alpha/beta-hydrolase, partial [Meredithblackwellia eburnea MCA 4105]